MSAAGQSPSPAGAQSPPAPAAGQPATTPPAPPKMTAVAGSGPQAAAGMSGAAAPQAGVTAAAGALAAGALAAGGGGMSGAVGGASGSAGAASAPTFPDCKSDAEPNGPCGTFTTQAGVKIQLGPYGAVVDRNAGKGFEVPLASGDSDGGASCASVVASFGEDPEKSKPLLDTTGVDFALYSVFRPAMWAEGEKYPIITWGDGTCAKPEGYGALLRYVASHGFVVVAANSRWVGSNKAMTKALDFAFAANDDSSSPYYKRLDTSKVGAMGHSQGGMATIEAARDARVKTVIIWNGGSSAVKPFLAVSGDMDIGNPTVASMKNALKGDPAGGYLFYHMTVGDGPVKGHLTLMTQPERVVEPATAWFKYQLLGDMESKAFFVGTDCKLCNTPAEFEFGHKGLM